VGAVAGQGAWQLHLISLDCFGLEAFAKLIFYLFLSPFAAIIIIIIIISGLVLSPDVMGLDGMR